MPEDEVGRKRKGCTKAPHGMTVGVKEPLHGEGFIEVVTLRMQKVLKGSPGLVKGLAGGIAFMTRGPSDRGPTLGRRGPRCVPMNSANLEDDQPLSRFLPGETLSRPAQGTETRNRGGPGDEEGRGTGRTQEAPQILESPVTRGTAFTRPAPPGGQHGV